MLTNPTKKEEKREDFHLGPVHGSSVPPSCGVGLGAARELGTL